MRKHFQGKSKLPFSGHLIIWDPDTFMAGPPNEDLIKWFDAQTDADWQRMAKEAR